MHNPGHGYLSGIVPLSSMTSIAQNGPREVSKHDMDSLHKVTRVSSSHSLMYLFITDR